MMTSDTAPVRRHSTWKWLLGVALLGLLVTAGALIATDPADNVRLSDARVRTDPLGQRLVTGTFRNHTRDRTYDEVRIDVELLGPGDSVVTTMATTTRDLEPGETWTFMIPVPQPASEVARFRFAKLTCRTDGGAPDRSCSIGAPITIP